MKTIFRMQKAKTSDIPAIVKIHKSCVLEINPKFYPSVVIVEWLKDISQESVLSQFKKSAWLVVKTKKDQTVGFGQYSLKTGEIFQINILSRFQKQGVGKALYQGMLEDFKRKKAKEIFLNSTINAVGFYQKLGFVPIEKIKYSVGPHTMEMMRMKAVL